MATRFAGCQYGPLQLRGLLARRFEPGEHLVGWAVVTLDPRMHEVLVWISLMFLPGVGHGIAHSMTGGLRRFLVLTDRRVLVLQPTKKALDPGGKGIITDVSLDRANLRRSRAGTYSLQVPGEPRRMSIRLSVKAEGGIGRLARALEVMSSVGATRL